LLFQSFNHIDVARGDAGGAGAPTRAMKKLFLGILCWNEAKMGAEFGEVHPRRRDRKVEKGSSWWYMKYMTV